MKTLKKLAALLLALTMVLALCACSNQSAGTPGGDATQPAETQPASDATQPAETQPASDPTDEPGQDGSFTTLEAGKLHMSTNAAFPPYEMTTDDGGFEGIDVEIATAIAKKLGLELVVDDMSFNAALLAVQNGQSDVALGAITVNEKRLEVMDFSDSYATGVQVVIVKEDSPIQSIDDLVNADMIGCQADTTGYFYASDTPENGGYGEEHVTAFDTGALAVMALMQNQIDAVIIDNEPAKAYVAANEGLKILEGEWVVEDYAIGFAKGNDALKDAVNGALNELKADGTLQKILDKYIKAD